MSEDEARDIVAQAEAAYLLDAAHHELVTLSVRALARDLYDNTGRRMNGDEQALAKLAASTALVVHDRRQRTDAAKRRPS